ncbi:crotonobetainyl-CoA hydratase [Microbacterium terrae]|uniref:enoyl-CoA hydratase n=1 Tax=Microbacterium terrae TaxID=69369 RepID=A0A0M2H227_9MICO|nr:crotonase/enoyl-CoA hydratase family protein [Microbacterium terrae]KJL37504.1 Carnitinyl-CoA dehydratase [Microbacterium terrae]MBP1076333.1 crotonobetainyl-CoA hydratase [Microbacterium terrae]GLJ97157.1 enoyl-CoA hydratase [Microbacterium terrae]
MGREEAVDAPTVLTELRGAIALITLNRPHALNAVDAAMATALGDAIASASDDDRVRCIVITGAGRGFSAGYDLKAFARGEDAEHPEHPEWGFAGIVRHVIDKPVIAAVNGFAFGGGAEIALAADIAVAGDSTRIGFPEVARGLVAAAGGVVRLQRILPRRVASELLFTGAPMSADRALQHGLVNKVVEDDQVLDAALDLAGTISRNAPLAVQATKGFLRESERYASEWDADIWDAQDRLVMPVFDTDDAAEGARAFAEKRDPVWRGR